MRIRLTAIATLAILLVAVAATQAQKPRQRQKPPPKPANITQAKFQIIPRVIGGYVRGNLADTLGEWIANITEDTTTGLEDTTYNWNRHWKYRFVYGFGLGFEYSPRPNWAVGLNTEILWKNLSGSEVPAVRCVSYAASCMYRFRPQSARSAYLKPELGRINLSHDAEDDSLRLGSFTYFRFGLGLFRYTSSATNTRFEIYYRRIFTSDHKYRGDDHPSVGWDIHYIGVEMGVGIPL